ncbi:hypothetical protein LVK06_14405, partial [Tenacibaculum maritimum]|nr:hypothetical protein [Tenacibaculum maritimum]
VVPYLGDTKIAVRFDNIRINTDYQLIEGVVSTTYDTTWGDVEDTNDWAHNGIGNTASSNVDFVVSDVQTDPNGDILIIGENGELVELPGGEDTVITDSNGQVWTVDEQGNISNGGSQAEGGASNPENTNGVNNQGQATAITAKGVIVTFTKASDSKYGFDNYKSSYSLAKDLYKKLADDYYIPYKAVKKGDTETVIANLSITDSKIKPQDLIFKTKEGVAITKIDSTATSYTLQLKGTFDDAEVETQALVKQGAKYEVAGAFIQYQASPKNINVVLVNTTNTATNLVKEALQAIYKQAMVNLTITEIDNFKADLETLTPKGTIQSGESGFAAQYTEQQRQINSKLKEHPQYQQDAYYLILTDKEPSSSNEKGLMPIGRQFGYVYTANCNTANCIPLTAAHELGHGAFQLKHPFSNKSYNWSKGATNWLLDYSDGEKIPFVHWQAIHNPKLRVGIFDGDEEGEQVTITDISELKEFANADGTYTFISRSGKPITVSGDITEVIFSTGDSEICSADTKDPFRIKPFGTLTRFKLKDKTYTAAWKCVSKKFMGYMTSEDEPYIDTKTNKSIDSAIVGFPAVVNSAILFKVGKLSITPEEGGNNYTSQGDYQEYDFLSQRLKEVTKFNEVSVATFEPSLSQEVQQFIIDNIDKSGFDGKKEYDNDAYVFMHATQLEKHGILKGCFKRGIPGTLLKLIVKTHFNQRTGAASYTTPQFDEGHEEVPFTNNAKSLINHWKQYDLNYYPIVAEQVKNFEILDDADHDDLIEAFRSIMNISYQNVTSDNWDCFFDKIGFEKLKIVLKSLSNADDWGNETENLLLKVFDMANNNLEREKQLLDLLEDDNYALLYKIISITNDWADNQNPQFEGIVNYISKWLIQRSPKGKYHEMIRKAESWTEIPFDYKKYSELNVVPVAMANMLGLAGDDNISYEIKTNFQKSDKKIHIVVSKGAKPGDPKRLIFDNTESPYEYVVMDILHDFKIGGQEFKKQKILVPRLFVHWLAVNINGKNNEAFLRVFTEVIAVAAIPLTGGASSILLTIDATLATADIVFTIANNVDNQSLLGNEKFFNTWTAIYGVYNLRHLPSLISTVGSRSKTIFKYATNLVGTKTHFKKLIIDPTNKANFLEAFKKLSVEQKLDVIFRLDDLALAVKKEAELSNLGKRILYRTLVELKMECNIIFSTPKQFNIVVNATNTPYKVSLAIDYNNKRLGLGKIILNEDKTVSLVESSKWLPEGVEDVTEIAIIPNVITNVSGVNKASDIRILESSSNGNIYLSLVGGLREDIIKLQVDELLELRNIHNPNKLNHNCFTCAIKYQNEFTKGTNEVIEKIAKKYHAGVAPEEINKLIYDVFGFDNVKIHNALDFDNLTIKLDGIHQESVILVGKYEEDFIEDFTSHHAFNARRVANREWEIIDIQNGAKYDKTYIDDKFTSIEVFEVLYKDHTYISRNNLKRDLPKEVHVWVDKMPKEFLNTLEEVPYTKLQQFVREFDNKVVILSEFNKDPLLFKVWEAMERSPNIPVSIRTKITNLQNAKRVICK